MALHSQNLSVREDIRQWQVAREGALEALFDPRAGLQLRRELQRGRRDGGWEGGKNGKREKGGRKTRRESGRHKKGAKNEGSLKDGENTEEDSAYSPAETRK